MIFMVWCLQHWLWIHQKRKKKRHQNPFNKQSLHPPTPHLASQPTFTQLLTQPNFPVLSTTSLWFPPVLSITPDTPTVPLTQKKQSHYFVGRVGNLSPWTTACFYLPPLWADELPQNPCLRPCTEPPWGGIPPGPSSTAHALCRLLTHWS